MAINYCHIESTAEMHFLWHDVRVVLVADVRAGQLGSQVVGSSTLCPL